MKFMIKRILAFKYAIQGIFTAVKNESVYWIHTLSAIIVVSLGFNYELKPYEWMVIVFCIGLVFIAELFNSAIERVCDLISKDKSIPIKNIKDISAAAVLVTSMTALICGILVFSKYFFR